MKHTIALLLILIVSNITQSQSNDYGDMWKKVEQDEKNGLPKSALKLVTAIEKQALKDNKPLQKIKTLLYKSKYALILEEDAQLKIINDLKTEISKSKFPTNQILENILAKLYWDYFNQNRWQFYNRTKTEKKVNANDFRTWDLQTLFHEVHSHYQGSLKNKTRLQKESLKTYDALLIKANDSKTYRPTLFDFLAHNSLAFYKTQETNITRPAYKFEIDDITFLKDTKTFSNLNLVARDSTSLQLHALKIYQELIQFHSKEKALNALTNVNIERLKFVHKHATFTNKDSIYLETLSTAHDNLKNHETSGLYAFEIASIYYNQSKSYNPKTNKTSQWKAKEALNLCQTVLEKFPKSKGAKKCEILKAEILQPSIQITAETFLPIQQHSKLLVRYKNIETLNFNIYKLTEEAYLKIQAIYNKTEQLKCINSLNLEKTWVSKLKNEKDYQSHSTEILVPKLDNSRYLIAAFIPSQKETFAFTHLQVTNFAIVETETSNEKIFQIINRNHGEPIVNAKVSISYDLRNSGKEITKKDITDHLGQFTLKKEPDNWISDIQIQVEKDKQIANFGGYFLGRPYNYKNKDTAYKSFLFTDRSIYRPGQIVFFKAICMQSKANKSHVLNDTEVTITLFNVNGESLKSLDLKTNAFGSVSGEFILPENGLNGNYRIGLTAKTEYRLNGATRFAVEAYKRPKFETKFTPITEAYKINDSVSLKGTAMAYAGSPITQAKVVYRVNRKIEYPRWCYWRIPNISSESQEITHGEGVTNDTGEFDIVFKALPDLSVDKNNLPIFKYEITADVTDLNGETRSATTIVNIGYHAMIAKMDIDSRLNKTKNTHAISIDTKNLNDEFVPAKGNIKIYKLKAPNTVLRSRLWSAPDYQLFSKEEFYNYFPHEAFNNEDKSTNWKKGKLVLEKNFDTKISQTLKLGKTKGWESGQYVIILESKDKFGQLVKDEIKTTLFSPSDKAPLDNKLFAISTDKATYKIGETAQFTLESAAQNLKITVSIEKNNEIISTEIIELNNNKKTILIPVLENDLGGFVVHYSFAAFNNHNSGIETIAVPYPKTDLNIETLSFRNKLKPGNQETWSFSIKGTQGEKITTELLASMYDASLDQFKTHDWEFNPINTPDYHSNIRNNAHTSFNTEGFRVYLERQKRQELYQNYDQWNWFGFHFTNDYRVMARGAGASSRKLGSPAPRMPEGAENESEYSMSSDSVTLSEVVIEETNVEVAELNIEQEKLEFNTIQTRSNLKETGFFFPKLQTDDKGHVSFSFSTPEALTQWKVQLLAHSKTLESATKTLTTVTQKELMVTPNAPRFLREGDQIVISSKITNLTDQALNGEAALLLTDGITGKDLNSKLLPNASQGTLEKTFLAPAKGNTQVSWTLNIPEGIQSVQYKIVAKSGNYSDGEQNVLPVLSNRMLVTETLPMWIKSNETKTFTLEKLKRNTSKTLKHHKLTLEMTSNPAWYAIKALPYLMENPYSSNEQIFSRYYANALAQHIVNQNSKIEAVFKQWKNTDALSSNLENNQELKSILIEETPWLRDAQSETEQKKRIALLFDSNKMNNELNEAFRKLKNNQMPSGAWSWFNGGRENRYITQHIIAGFGHLKKLNITLNEEQTATLTKAIKYLDAQFINTYKEIKKHNPNADLSKDHLSHIQLHYLYTRSFFSNIKMSKETKTIMDYYQSQIKTYWLSRSLYTKGLMALISYRNDDVKTVAKILKSLQETSITSEELGMYWKANTNSWHWYQAPIETQALLIETFSEAGNTIQNNTKNLETIDNLKIWLLKNKQTTRWKTTKATTEAIYALVLQGRDWLSVTDMVDVTIGEKPITPSQLDNVKIEAGSGYYKTAWNTSEIKPEMGAVKLTKKGDGIAWGNLYWQYFEDLDQITSAETPLKLNKSLFLKTNTDKGEQMSKITSKTRLKVGDYVRVRIELRSDRNMEFIHMKDMRASGLEPINVISQYKWQDGLGYYETTKDASTNFFFDYLPKGVYVFEYDLRVNNAGNMSHGITNIQSMYAPEFSSHSEGIRINIE